MNTEVGLDSIFSFTDFIFEYLVSWSADAWIAAATFLAAFGAIGSAIYAAREYNRQGKQKRIEILLQMRQRLKEEKPFQEIVRCLDSEDETVRRQITTISKETRRDYLGFFEEIALLVNSGIMPKPVAQYLFGYYAIICDESEYFWNDFEKEHLYWTVFRKFAEDMRKAEGRFSYRKFRITDSLIR